MGQKNTKDKVNTKLVKNEIQMINWNCFIKKNIIIQIWVVEFQ